MLNKHIPGLHTHSKDTFLKSNTASCTIGITTTCHRYWEKLNAMKMEMESDMLSGTGVFNYGYRRLYK